jgi:hypothetical protein
VFLTATGHENGHERTAKMQATRITEAHLAEALAMGREAAVNAASWATDGNTTDQHRRRVLAGMADGDPRVDDYLPAYPTLSGEWADSLTPITLWETITGEDHAEAEEAAGLAYETVIGSAIDALATEWEEGVAETFYAECERVIRAGMGV